MRHVLVRYGEIGTKSDGVRSKMAKVLRQRVVDRLKYEEIDFEKVSLEPGRIIVETEQPEKAAELAAELPGVASSSPALKTDAGIEKICEATEKFDIGESFGLKTNRAGNHDFDSREVNIEVGEAVEDKTGASVDLEDPETWLEIDIRFGDAYLFTERFTGPNGYPVGAEEPLAALVSGGIDSPVAAYQVMTRGSDIMPVYFYNKPVSAEDHLLRFKSVVDKLERFHPGKKWWYYVVDMEEINEELMKVERGRMVLHRKIMFGIAERIAEKEGLEGIVTGESMGQKSSQTPSNLAKTSSTVELPVHRPLLTWTKNRITDNAREIGTLEDAEIASACVNLAPDSPATSIQQEDLEELEEKVGLEELVEKGFENAEKFEA